MDSRQQSVLSQCDSDATYEAEEEYFEGYAYQESELLDEDDKEAQMRANMNPDANPMTTVSKDAFLPPDHEVRAVTTFCDDLQMEAVRVIVSKSRPLSVAAYPSVLKKAERLGYTEDQLKRTLLYVRDEAPMIIQVKFDQDDRLKKMTADTNYRSIFEIGLTNGGVASTSVAGWEDRMFDNVYTKAKPFQRAKYGVINIVNDPVGIKAAHGYGDSHFVMKGVRLRASFSDCDTASAASILASCEHYCHVMDRYDDSALKSVIDVATGKTAWIDSSLIGCFKEVQYHGEIQFAKNIKRVVVNDRHKGDKNMPKILDQFCEKNGCDWLYCDDLRKETESNHAKKQQQAADEEGKKE